MYYGLRGGSYDIVVRQEEALTIWWILALGFALGVLPRARPPRGAAVPLAALGLLAVWTAISLAWTPSDERTFAELDRFLHYAGLLLLIWSLVDAQTWRAAAAGLVSGAVAICVLAVVSRLHPAWFPPNYVRIAFQTKRLGYPFNYWNAVGCFAVMASAIALGWSAHARGWLTRCASLAAAPWCIAAAYLTFSRAALFGAAVALLVMFSLGRNRWTTAAHAIVAAGGSALAIAVINSHHEIEQGLGTRGAAVVLLALLAASAIGAAGAALTRVVRADARWRLPRRPAQVALMAGVVAVAIVVPATAHGTIASRWHEFRHDTVAPNPANPAERFSHLNGNRYFIWRSALRAFTHEPLKGVGSGTFEFWWSEHGGGEFLRDAHSLYLEELGEQGLPGGILIVVLIGGLAALLVQARRRGQPDDLGPQVGFAAAFGAYAVQAGVDWMWESTAVTVLALAAAALGACSLSSRAAPLRARARLPLVAFAVVAALVQIPSLASTVRIRASQGAFDHGNTATALARATDGIKTEPWAASPYVQRALVEESLGRLSAARADLLAARVREPTNWRQPLLLARVDAERGDARAAEADFREAKRLRPKSSFVTPSG